MSKDKPFQPMLAYSGELDLDKLPYPLLASTKMDGMRAVVTSQGALTRTLKPIPNGHIRSALERLPPGLDGEIGVLGADGAVNFRGSMRACRNTKGEPDFRYFVFDNFLIQGPYDQRLDSLSTMNVVFPDWLIILEQIWVTNRQQVETMFEHAVADGHEGLILRRGDAPYKHGRSTLDEAGLLKVKPWKDTEAIVIGMVQAFENTNEAVKDERGYTKRSSAKAGKVAKDMMGALEVRMIYKGKMAQFEIGTGFDEAERIEFWAMREHIIGKQWAKFRYVDVGGYDVPRSCSFLGFRIPEDMSQVMTNGDYGFMPKQEEDLDL